MAKKQSAGIIVYRRVPGGSVEVLLGHPGGPFWAKKDRGAWSIPKGEFDEPEAPLVAAKREFKEELGFDPPDGDYIDLDSFKRPDGKVIFAWAVEGSPDIRLVRSNTFEMEWPPKSGIMQQFPEIDRAEWFGVNKAAAKLHKGQDVFLHRLAEKLGLQVAPPPEAEQTKLF